MVLHQYHFFFPSLIYGYLSLFLSFFSRKVPSLRACYGDRNGERWLREMSEETIDFEVGFTVYFFVHSFTTLTHYKGVAK